MQTILQDQTDDEESASFHDAKSTSSPSKSGVIRNLGQRTKTNVKRLFHHDRIRETSKTSSQHEGEEPTGLLSDPAFGPRKDQAHNHAIGQQSSAFPSLDDLRNIADKAIHPRKGITQKVKSTAARKIGTNHQSHITIDHDQEYLDAYDELAKATLNASSPNLRSSPTDANDLKATQERIRVAEEKRESLQAAWVLGRYVDRVRVVPSSQPKPELQLKSREPRSRFEWERYLAQLALYYSQNFTLRYVDDDTDTPPFDVQALARIVERLATTSAPWQIFLLDLRSIYMWTDPIRTARWALTFWTLWYIENLVGFFYGLIVYLTLYNKFHASSATTIRDSVQRRRDRKAQAMAWGELVQQHGNQDWMEPLMQELGPIIQLQLSDLANFLEILVNFYNYGKASKTTATVVFFSICFFITLVADMAFCVKLVWFIVGVNFFFSFPIATRYPKYRILVSSLRWVFWDIPTHAELAIQKLQERAVFADLDRDQSRDPEPSDGEDDSSFISTTSSPASTSSSNSDSDSCSEKYNFPLRRHAKVTVTRHYLEYYPSPLSKTKDKALNAMTANTRRSNNRKYAFQDLIEIEKLHHKDSDSNVVNNITTNLSSIAKSNDSSSPSPKSTSGQGLRFTFRAQQDPIAITDNHKHNHDDTDEEHLTIQPRNASDRDRIFNLILAFSAKQWRVLQSKA